MTAHSCLSNCHTAPAWLALPLMAAIIVVMVLPGVVLVFRGRR